MLPDIDTEDGGLAIRQRAILVGRADDFEVAGSGVDEPCPAGAEAVGASGVDLFLELVEATELRGDCLRQRASGL